MSPPEDDAFMQERSHRASDTAYEIGKSTAQACLLINGGAATAVLAVLAKEHPPAIPQMLTGFSLGLYALGVAMAAVMMFSVMRMADEWNYFWYWMSHGNDLKKGRKAESAAHMWKALVFGTFTFSIACFVVASTLLACGLSKPW
jgi:hypothetical protein